jgi:hypothetical protein
LTPGFRNCAQAADSPQPASRKKINVMRNTFTNPEPAQRLKSLFTLLALMAIPSIALAQPTPEPPRHTLMAVFSDRPMADAQWQALSTALREQIAADPTEMRPLRDQQLELVRGDTLRPGQTGDDLIVVFLHGACDVVPQADQHHPKGPLAWVLQDHGAVRPFVQVDCTRLAQVLDNRTLGMNRDQRRIAMARATARVVIHEWLHIALQNSTHGAHGIDKAQLTVDDLIDAAHIQNSPRGTGR